MIATCLRTIRCPAYNASLTFYIHRSLRALNRRKNKLPSLCPEFFHERRVLRISLSMLLFLSLVCPDSIVSPALYPYENFIHFQQEKARLDILEKRRIAAEILAREEAREKERVENERQAYVEYINKKYYISKRAAHLIVIYSEKASKEFNLPISLILAVIAKESKFNPFAGSIADAEGLMQVIAKWHPEKMKQIGGEKNIIQPDGNIKSGSKALRETLNQCNGNIVCALQTYNGNIGDETTRYANKVLSEQDSIKQWMKDKHRT